MTNQVIGYGEVTEGNWNGGERVAVERPGEVEELRAEAMHLRGQITSLQARIDSQAASIMAMENAQRLLRGDNELLRQERDAARESAGGALTLGQAAEMRATIRQQAQALEEMQAQRVRDGVRIRDLSGVVAVLAREVAQS